MSDELLTKIESLKDKGYVECPRCRMFHNNLLNPQAVSSKTKGPKSGVQETVTSVSYVCDKCCDQLLDAFADPDWKLFWPTVTDEEAETIVFRILASRKVQIEHYKGKSV